MAPGEDTVSVANGNFAHSFAPHVSGGVIPYIWEISGLPSGSPLPSGLAITTTGALTGIAVASGNHIFRLTVTGANGAGQQFSITLNVP